MWKVLVMNPPYELSVLVWNDPIEPANNIKHVHTMRCSSPVVVNSKGIVQRHSWDYSKLYLTIKLDHSNQSSSVFQHHTFNFEEQPQRPDCK